MSELDEILSPDTIRSRTRSIYESALAGHTHFEIDLARMSDVVSLVEQVTRQTYPSLAIPLHGRFEHLRAGGVDRIAQVSKALKGDAKVTARALIDLVTTSVLLDAGAGMAWRFIEGDVVYSKSEGLAVASAVLFQSGALSDDAHRPLQATAAGLRALTREKLADAFQVRADNPLFGLDGRLGLMQRLGECVESLPGQRPGGLLDLLLSQPQPVSAATLLKTLLIQLNPMWPARATVEGIRLGDVWPYRGTHFKDIVPFHKLSQWLTYSLIEPMQMGGVQFAGLEALTGLPEYRNGGLFLDAGVLRLKDQALATVEHGASSELIVEWRALTVQLLDQVAGQLRTRLGLSVEQLPLAKVLQGGTWAAGRLLAAQKRADGGPPLRLKSDGMVF